MAQRGVDPRGGLDRGVEDDVERCARAGERVVRVETDCPGAEVALAFDLYGSAPVPPPLRAVAGPDGRAEFRVPTLSDEVAYLRFASVYKDFDAAADFQSELELLSKLGSAPTACR